MYAMRVTETLTTSEYWEDPRFECKRPNLHHNWVSASGDNIYELQAGSKWRQLDSYHSRSDGRPNEDHLRRDTSVERILISDDFVYYGGGGPELPVAFQKGGNMDITRGIRNYQRVYDPEIVSTFLAWLRSDCDWGYQGRPWDWIISGSK